MHLYEIFGQINKGAFTYLTTIKHPISSPVIYSDTINTISDTFSYHVFTLDTCGDTSNYSPTHTTVHLSANITGCQQAINLTWNQYAGWPSVKKYEIYRSTNGGAENLLATVLGKTTNYSDASVNYHNSYCYRVLAYDSAATYTSWSNKICGQTYFLDTAQMITVTHPSTSRSEEQQSELQY